MADNRYTEEGPTQEDEFLANLDLGSTSVRDQAFDLPRDVSGNETDHLFLEPGVEVHGGATLRSLPADGDIRGDRFYDPAGGLVDKGTAPDFAGLQSSDDDDAAHGRNSDLAEEQRFAQLGDGEDEPPAANVEDNENAHAEWDQPDSNDKE